MAADARVNILLVDDQPENLMALEAVLADLGQNLVKATSGLEALKRLLHEDFAVILLDVKMPEIDGFETAELIRSRERNQHTPIVFLTAYSKNEMNVSRGYSIGAVDYVFKPFVPEVLRAKVVAFVELAKKTQELREESNQRRQAEEEVRQLNAGLERRVTERTAELQAANRALKREIAERRRAEEERTRLLELEQAARARAELVQQRLLFLGQASAILAGSLDYETTLGRVAQLAVPYMADFCIVDLVSTDGTIHRVTSAHAQPEKNDLLRRLREGYAPQTRSRQPAARVLRSGQPELVSEVDEAWLEGASLDDEHREILRALAPHSYLVVPLEARGHKLGVISFGVTTSDRKYDQDDLVLAEDLARRAAAAIDNARLFQEVQEAGRRKDEFLAMLAHELRNPLAAVASASYALEQLQPEDRHRQARLHSVIARQTGHLSRLVDDLLDVSRITQGKIELRFEDIDLSGVIHGAVETIRPLIESRQQHLTVSVPEEPLLVRADATRLEQVLSNLLNNATKYTDPGGHIWLSVGKLAEEEPAGAGSAGMRPLGVEVRVRDTGIGIPAELQPHVFDLFTQSTRSLDRAQGGLGIGLSLVKVLIEKHGGRVSVVSEGPGKGSEFIVQLPGAPPMAMDGSVPRPNARQPIRFPRQGPPKTTPPQKTPPPAPSTAPPAAKEKPPESQSAGVRKVLVVDDNVDAAQTLAELLELWGYEVQVALDGPQALDACREYHPEVVLLDIGLPTMDGYQVARRLREPAFYQAAGRGAKTGNGDKTTPARTANGRGANGSESRRGGVASAPEPEAVPANAPLLVALSGYGQPEDRRRSFEAGFQHHLTKPVDPHTLRQLLESGPPAS